MKSVSVDSSQTLTILTLCTEVVDGESTEIIVQTSPINSGTYQWKKNGQPLDNSSTCSGVHDDILAITYASQGTEGEYTCCINSLGLEVCSNKINLTVLYPPAKKRLLNLYSVKNEVPQDSWPPEGSSVYITLALIRSSKDSARVSDYSVCGDADVIIASKEKVEYKQMFGDHQSRELILVEGRPGSGKTTLVHKIVKDWVEGRALVKAKLVYLITVRVLNYSGTSQRGPSEKGTLY